MFTVKRPAEPILKLLNSALASARNDFKLSEDNLYISKITVDAGPTLKRSNPESRGRAFPIMKRTSHIVLILSERNETKKEVNSKEDIKVAEKTKEKREAKSVKTKVKKVTKKK
jgi:large subunit ribosomal protein L22